MNELEIFRNVVNKNYSQHFFDNSYNGYIVENNIRWSLGYDILLKSTHIDLSHLFHVKNNEKYEKFFLKIEKSRKIILIVSLLLIDETNYQKFEEIINFIYFFNRNILLIIDECCEGTEKNEFKRYESLLKEKFNDNFFIITGNKYMENKDNYIYHNMFKYYNFDYLISNPKHDFDFYFSRKKNNLENIKLFVSFNRREREHRLSFAHYIQKSKLKYEYFLSLDAFKDYKYMKNFNINEKEIKEIIRPLYIDTKNFTINKADNMPFKIYCNSFFSHVNETTFNEDSLFISEKTYKPIILMHPFTLMGNPYTLRELKAQGFEVDFKGINNSYDLEKNHEKRMLIIIDEIKKLDSLSKEGLLDFYYENKDILIHNRNNFLNINKKRREDEAIIKERITNKFNNIL